MPTQTDVQKLIQSLVPGAANNGNPNTVYNTAPPTMDADGNWYAANLPSAASITGLQRAATTLPQGSGGWVAPTGTQAPTRDLRPVPGPLVTNHSWVPRPTVTPPVVQRPTTPPVRPATQGGRLNPQDPVQGQYRNPAINRRERMRENQFPTEMLQHLQGQQDWRNQGTGPYGSYGAGGNLQWQQIADGILDMVGLRGDSYLSGTKKWDMSNILSSLAGNVTGLGGLVGGGLQRVGEYQMRAGSNNPNIMERIAIDHAMDNIQNAANLGRGTPEGISPYGPYNSGFGGMRLPGGVNAIPGAPNPSSYDEIIDSLASKYSGSGAGSGGGGGGGLGGGGASSGAGMGNAGLLQTNQRYGNVRSS